MSGDRLLPLLAARDLDAPFAWHAGTPISAATFLADAARLAERLPAAGPVVNLCTDRYRFAVGFAAALQRGHASLLPPNALADTLARLRVEYPSLHSLGDDDVAIDGEGRSSAIPYLRRELAAACLLTSGSTGAPQPHTKRWGMLVANIDAESRRLAETLGRASLAGVNVVATVPSQHSYGFESSVLLALLGGAAFDSGRPFYPADVAQALQRLPRPRVLVTTPFHLKTTIAAGVALPATDLVLSATAPLSPQLAVQAERAFAGPLLEIYGCTEAGQVATRRTVHGAVWRTFGSLELRMDGESAVVEGGHVEQPTPLADVLELESPTHFRLLGRANDLIRVAGKRSSLAHLNYHLNSIDGVRDGAFWLPEEDADDAGGVVRLVAFVVAPGLSGRRIVDALRPRVEAAFLPRRVLQVEALPRNATGKLTSEALQRFALERLSRAGAPHGR